MEETRISVRMPSELSQKLDALAKATNGGIPKRAYIERVLTDHVAKADANRKKGAGK